MKSKEDNKTKQITIQKKSNVEQWNFYFYIFLNKLILNDEIEK
jgi:hypothetical protein